MTVENTAPIPVGLMQTGVRASVGALVEAAASGEVTVGASVAAGALAEAMAAAIGILPGEIAPIS
jgi:hypothetical protein